MLKALTRCKDRLAFVDNITQYMEKYRYIGPRTNNRKKYFGEIRPKSLKFCYNVSDTHPYTIEEGHFSVMDEVGLEFKRETSWLYTDDRYEYLRELAVQDKIVVITESICETSTFTAICKILRDNMLQLDTVYISNIAAWMFSHDDQNSFLSTIRQLIFDQQTLVIDAYRERNKSSPIQRCILASDLTDVGMENWFFPSSDLSEEDSLEEDPLLEEGFSPEPNFNWNCCIS